MINQNRRYQIPSIVGPAKKRKEREGERFNANLAKPLFRRPGSFSPVHAKAPEQKNLLLAGYLAHEFLSKGTLFGKPPRSAAVTAPATARPPEDEGAQCNNRYVEIANLLKSGEAHLPGIVNPAQLARFLQL
ncbi:uncharacterized protein LOC124916467 [Impatiens glandulifera]|uniref:uncharacterized protein LOC124916467 n=1 Tax=Impatiens glandulifera TaxID=253017 RepID=UPI001FB13967|nr:uncharacterized protein LOC124916467 [Impatiens glandulifera]